MSMLAMPRLVKNTLLLTLISVGMRCISLVWQGWLAARIGAAGIGLLQVIGAVGMLSVTISISGARFTAIRLVSQEAAHGDPGRAMRLCLLYALGFGLLSCGLMHALARPIGFLWLGDARAVRPLRLYAMGLPCLALSSVLGGYFTAVGRVWKSAVVQLGEQLVSMAIAASLLSTAAPDDLTAACQAITGAGSAANLVSLLGSAVLYLLDCRRYCQPGHPGRRLGRRMLTTALPLAVSAYARTGLATLQNLLVPRGLKASGLSAESAMAGYGIIQGMVFPAVALPTELLGSLAEIIVPTLTAAQAAGQRAYIRQFTESLLERTLAFALGAAGLLFIQADSIAMVIYHAPQAGQYIRLFAFCAPFMYLDIVTDGCLKGLGQMLYSMGCNIAEALISVALIWTLLPRYALPAYLLILMGTELFNFTLSFHRLRQVSGLALSPGVIAGLLLCAAAAGTLVRLLPRAGSWPGLLLSVFLQGGLYIALVGLFFPKLLPRKAQKN